MIEYVVIFAEKGKTKTAIYKAEGPVGADNKFRRYHPKARFLGEYKVPKYKK